MSIFLLFQLDGAQLDGTTLYTFDAEQWSSLGPPNQFLCTLPAAQDLGIVDPLEVLIGIEDALGPVLGRVAPDVGSTALLTDFVVERVITWTPAEVNPGTTGSHSPTGIPDVAGVRLRDTTILGVTNTAGARQGGGAGQVSATLVANGVTGLTVLPTGTRWWIESPAVAGDHAVGLWLFPLVGPDVAQGGLAGQPPAQFA